MLYLKEKKKTQKDEGLGEMSREINTQRLKLQGRELKRSVNQGPDYKIVILASRDRNHVES